MQSISVGRVNNDIVRDVGIYRDFVVLGGRIDVDSAGVVSEVVVGDRQQLRVLDVEIHDADRCVVQDADSAVLDVVGLERDAWIGLADVLEYEAACLVSCHRVVSDALQLTSAFKQQQRHEETRSLTNGLFNQQI